MTEQAVLAKYYPGRLRSIAARRFPAAAKPGGIHGLALQDLAQAGAEGLVHAMRRRAADDDVEAWESFLVSHAVGAMHHEIRRADYLPEKRRALTLEMERAARRLEAEHGCPPTRAEVAHDLGLAMAEVDELAGHSLRPDQLDVDNLPHPVDPTPTAEELLAEEEAERCRRAAWQMALVRLDGRTRQIFALVLEDGLGQTEAAARLGVTKSLVSKRLRVALTKLGDAFGVQLPAAKDIFGFPARPRDAHYSQPIRDRSTSGSWRIVYYSGTGDRRSKSFKSREAAMAWKESQP